MTDTSSLIGRLKEQKAWCKSRYTPETYAMGREDGLQWAIDEIEAMGDASARKDEVEVQNGQSKTSGDQPAPTRTTSPANGTLIELTSIEWLETIDKLESRIAAWKAVGVQRPSRETAIDYLEYIISEINHHLKLRGGEK